MTKFGMTPMDAIRSATVRPAEMLDMQGGWRDRARAYADIIAVREIRWSMLASWGE